MPKARLLRPPAFPMAARFAEEDGRRIDEGLTRLLEVERRLDGRIRDAEQEARRRVDAARATLARASAEQRAELESLARAEEQADLQAHAETLRRVETERAADLRALSDVSGARVDRIARDILALFIADDGAVQP